VFYKWRSQSLVLLYFFKNIILVDGTLGTRKVLKHFLNNFTGLDKSNRTGFDENMSF